jgi:uncharacterized YigZ family protein
VTPRHAPPTPPDAAGDPPDGYLTLGASGEDELKIQRSRFVACATPATDAGAAGGVVADIARRFHDARHVCWASRLGAPPAILESRNDGGEPSGTAGEPILAEIRKADLTDVVVAVVRYFGGVKLGTGGLARAYGEAAAAALAAAPRREVRLGRHFTLRFPYAFQKSLARLLAHAGGEIVAEEYGADVVWQAWLPHSGWRDFAAAVREASAGRVTADPLD